MEGWVYIDGARKWHYVRADGRSVCGRWLYLGSAEPQQGKNDSPDNCPGCMKKLAKLGPAAPAAEAKELKDDRC